MWPWSMGLGIFPVDFSFWRLRVTVNKGREGKAEKTCLTLSLDKASTNILNVDDIMVMYHSIEAVVNTLITNVPISSGQVSLVLGK